MNSTCWICKKCMSEYRSTVKTETEIKTIANFLGAPCVVCSSNADYLADVDDDLLAWLKSKVSDLQTIRASNEGKPLIEIDYGGGL